MRRYRRREFEALFDERDGRGWVTVRQTSGFSTIFLPALATRLWWRMMMRGGEARSDTQPVAEWLNRLLIAAHGPETAWLSRRDLPIGISFMTIRRKHDARAPGTARRSS